MFEKRINLILFAVVIVLFAVIAVSIVIANSNQASTGENTAETVISTTQVTEAAESTDVAVVSEEVKVLSGKAKASKASKTSKSSASADKKDEKSTKPTESTEPTTTIPFATAKAPAVKASYDAQWNAGYLVAIDNPDKSYSCRHVELTDENREVLEHLCMGEFGVGGFTGAALIAQAVKDAMVHYGISDVKTVIKQLHYTGKLKNNPSQSVKDAVIYVFDMDKDAVQHRILYMYNPYKKRSAFHESQKYICTFGNVRFFDR